MVTSSNPESMNEVISEKKKSTIFQRICFLVSFRLFLSKERKKENEVYSEISEPRQLDIQDIRAKHIYLYPIKAVKY